MAAAAEVEEDETEGTLGGVGPGVAGDPREVISVPLCPVELGTEPLPLLPPLLLPFRSPCVESLMAVGVA